MALTNLSQITTSGISTLADINLNNLTGVAATFTGNVTVGGTLTYDDVTNIDSVGLITARNGLSITGGDLTLTDSIVHDSDADTKIRFPAADTITVETAGSERLRVTSDGDVNALTGHLQAQDFKLGLAANRYPIIQRAVQSSGSQDLSITGGSGYSEDSSSPHSLVDAREGAMIKLGAGDPTSDTYGGYIKYFAHGHTSPNASGQGNAHVFYTRSGADTNTERLRITSGGNVKIGPAGNPGFGEGSGLEVERAGAATIRIEDTSSSSSFEIQNTSGVIKQRLYNNQPWTIEYGSGEKLRITSAGKLLVGSTITSNSAAIQGFSAHGNTAGESGVTSADTNAMAAGIGGEIAFYGKTDGTATPYNYLGHIRGIKENGTNANTACALTFYTRPTLTAPQERLRITSAGLVGIGTINPDTLLSINGSTSTQKLITLSSGTSKRNNYIGVNNADNLEIGADEDNEGNDSSIRFRVDGSERVCITSAGNIGIGTDVPAELLHLNGATNKSLLRFTSGSYGTASTDGSHVGINFGGLELWHKENNYLRFGTNNTERLRILSAGRIGIGTDTPTAKLEITDAIGETGEEILLKLQGRATKNVYLDINADANRRGVIRFKSAGTDKWSIGRGDSDELSDNSFFIATGNSGGNTAKLVIDSDGNMGLGAINPGADPAIGNSATVFEIRQTTAGNISAGNNRKGAVLRLKHEAQWENGYQDSATDDLGRVEFVTGDSSTGEGVRSAIRCRNLQYYNNHALTFEVANSNSATITERLRITSAGNIGIGTDSPDHELVVRGSQPFLEIRDNRNQNWSQNDVFSGILFSSEDVYGGNQNQIPHGFIKAVHTRAGSNHATSDAGLTFGTSASTTSAAIERLRITNDGKMGLGETSPLGQFHIKTGDSGASSVGASADEFVIEGSANSGMTILSGTTGQGLINFADSGDVNVGNITYDHTSNFMSFKTSDAERLRIHSSGKISVGDNTNVSYGDFQVNQSADNDESGIALLNDAESRSMRLYCDNSNNSIINSGDGGGGVLKLNEGAGQVRIGSGGLTFNGDSANANALNDYEEGTLNWRLQRNNVYAGTNFVSDLKYTKIGNRVFVSGYLYTQNTGTATGVQVQLRDNSNTANPATLPYLPNHEGGFTVTGTRTINDSYRNIAVTFMKNNTRVYIYTDDGNNAYNKNADNVNIDVPQTHLVLVFNGSYTTDS